MSCYNIITKIEQNLRIQKKNNRVVNTTMLTQKCRLNILTAEKINIRVKEKYNAQKYERKVPVFREKFLKWTIKVA